MYIPKPFEVLDVDRLHNLIRCNPLATLVVALDSGLNADLITVYLNLQEDGKTVLQGHIATQNDLWKRCGELEDCLLLFQGGNAYVSPSFYPSKAEDGKVVPTWNYMVVQVKGRIRFIHEPSWKLNMLQSLTDEHEKHRDPPWAVSDAPQDYIEHLLAAIVGFEVEIQEVIGKFKLNQNHSVENRKGVIAGLSKSGNELAKWMQKDF